MAALSTANGLKTWATRKTLIIKRSLPIPAFQNALRSTVSCSCSCSCCSCSCCRCSCCSFAPLQMPNPQTTHVRTHTHARARTFTHWHHRSRQFGVGSRVGHCGLERADQLCIVLRRRGFGAGVVPSCPCIHGALDQDCEQQQRVL